MRLISACWRRLRHSRTHLVSGTRRSAGAPLLITDPLVSQIASGLEKPTYPFTLPGNGTGGDYALRSVGKGDPSLDGTGEGVATGSLC